MIRSESIRPSGIVLQNWRDHSHCPVRRAGRGLSRQRADPLTARPPWTGWAVAPCPLVGERWKELARRAPACQDIGMTSRTPQPPQIVAVDGNGMIINR